VEKAGDLRARAALPLSVQKLGTLNNASRSPIETCPAGAESRSDLEVLMSFSDTIDALTPSWRSGRISQLVSLFLDFAFVSKQQSGRSEV
jgi:hypothetical protein